MIWIEETLVIMIAPQIKLKTCIDFFQPKSLNKKAILTNLFQK